MIHTVKGFSIVNKAEIDVFLEVSCFFHDPVGVGNLISGSSEYYSAIKKNTFEAVLMRWMKLEPIIQSEVSQKETHQYSILMHIYRI